jgi:hypothetical protein
MSLPGFNAEASLYITEEKYYIKGRYFNPFKISLLPQQIVQCDCVDCCLGACLRLCSPRDQLCTDNCYGKCIWKCERPPPGGT